MENINCDAIVIGGGAAEMTAGIYLNRAGQNVILVESNILGGVAGTIEQLDNYPGLPVGGTGFDLAMNMSSQIEHLGIQVQYGTPSSIDLANKTVVVAGKALVAKKGVVLAMGAGNKKLGLDGEDALLGNGLSYCATCDGAFFKGRNTVIVGNTLHTLSDAFYLEQVPCASVTLVVPSDRVLAPKTELEKLANSKIKVVYDTAIQGIDKNERGKVTAIQTKSKSGTSTKIPADALFVTLGYTPNTALVYGQIETDDKGYIKVDMNSMQTNQKGAYAIGDIRSGSVKQIVGSCYDGMIASMDIIKQR